MKWNEEMFTSIKIGKAKDTMIRVYKHLEKTFKKKRLETRRNFIEHHVSRKISRFWFEHLIDRKSRFRMFVTLERVHDLQWNLQTCKNYHVRAFGSSPWNDESSKLQCLVGREIRGTLGLLTLAFAFPAKVFLSQWKFYFPWNLPNLLAETFTLGQKNYSFDKVTRITTATTSSIATILYFLRYFNHS